MISVAGMEGGSGDGTAASRKAGWLAGAPPPRYSAAAPRLPSARSAAGDLVQALANVALDRLANQLPPATTVPQPYTPARAPAPGVDANGRPLPPDGSAPPARPISGPITPPVSPRPSRADSAAAAPPASPTTGRASSGPTAPPVRPPEFAPDGRPLPPNGAAPPPAPAPRVATPRPQSGTAFGPIAPAGHSFVARPVSAPPGEFRFAVRCSCGRQGDAAVTLATLRDAAARGQSPAAAIAAAQQTALDAMHRA